jgi:hypothetical protein
MPGISINVANPYNASDYVPIYGNYCGPGWTGGQRNGSNFNVPAIDAVDRACREHDWQYLVASYTPNPTDAARIIANADFALLKTASTLLAENMRPNTPSADILSSAGLAYTGLMIDAFAVKALTIDSANVIKGDIQNALQGLSDFIKSRSGVPLSFQDQFGTTSTLTLGANDNLKLTASATLDDGSKLSSEAVSSPFEESAGQVGLITRPDGSVDVVANGDGESVSVANADVYVARDSTVAIDLPGNTVHADGSDDIEVYTNHTSITTDNSDINFNYVDLEGDYVSGYNNTVDYYYVVSGGYSPAMAFETGGVDSRSLGFEFSEFGDVESTAAKGNDGRKFDPSSTHHVSVKVSSATPVSIEHLIQSIAAFGNQETGMVDGFSFTNTLVSDPEQQGTLRNARMLAVSH